MTFLPKDPKRDVLPIWRTTREAVRVKEAFGGNGHARSDGLRRPGSNASRTAGANASATPRESALNGYRDPEQIEAEWAQTSTPYLRLEILYKAMFAQQPSLCERLASELLTSFRDVPTVHDFLSGIADGSSAELIDRAGHHRPVSTVRALQGDGSGESKAIAHGNHFGREIASIRGALRGQCFDAGAWMDLARWHTITGSTKKALRAARTAWGLGSENRHIVRSYVGFVVHSGDPVEGLHRIRQCSALPFDPWLIATETALSSITKSKAQSLVRGVRMLSANDFPPFELGELAAAVATEELASGRSWNSAKKKLGNSLSDLNANAAAQFAWLGRRKIIAHLPADLERQLNRSFEADTWRSYYARDFSAASAHAENWFAEEPFSARSSSLYAFLVGIAFGQPAAAVEILRISMKSNPDDFVVRNNFAYFLAKSNRVNEAIGVVSHSWPEAKADQVVATATMGLLEFRKDRPEYGRRFYSKALEMADSMRELPEVGSAAWLQIAARLQWTLEELRLGSEFAHPLALQSLEFAKNARQVDPALEIMSSLVEQHLEQARI